MSRFVLPALILIATPLLLASSMQKRVKPKEAADFPSLITQASQQWNEKHYGSCIASLHEAIALATAERITLIRAALPDAPANWKLIPEKKKSAQSIPGFAALGAVTGNIVERRWKATEGRGNMNATVTADSPLIGMLSTYLTNPALMGENRELIEYGTHKAVLETSMKGARLKLQIIMNGKDIADITVNEMTEEQLFAMWNQDAVDGLASALSL